MPEAIGAEAFGDEEELARVSEFLSTVKEIEELTGLDFSRAIRRRRHPRRHACEPPHSGIDAQAVERFASRAGDVPAGALLSCS